MAGAAEVYPPYVVPVGSKGFADVQAPMGDAPGEIVKNEPKAVRSFVISGLADLESRGVRSTPRLRYPAPGL